VFDTGFDAPMGRKRNRQFVRSPAVGLKAIGGSGDVQDVILSHLHYDHCGNHDLFPHARYHVQDIEMAYAPGGACATRACAAVRRKPTWCDRAQLFAGRVAFHRRRGRTGAGAHPCIMSAATRRPAGGAA